MSATALIEASADPPAHHAPRLRECPDCGLIQRLPAMNRAAVASCPRCGAILRRRRDDPVGRPLALALAGLVLLLLAASLPFMELRVSGLRWTTSLLTGPAELQQYGVWELSIVVLATTLAIPLARMAALGFVLVGMRLHHPPALMPFMLRCVEWLRPWAMVEVFMLGVFVAYTRLTAIATVDLGPALYALAALVLISAAADASLDMDALWETMERRGIRPAASGAMPAPHPLHAPTHWIGCDTCGMVCPSLATCPRCGASLRRRKTSSQARTAALLVTSVILYVPANVLPILTVVRLARGAPSTILGGVKELLDYGMWPLALLVFFASITVPVLKIVGLTVLLVATRRRARTRLRERTRLYRIIDSIGRWSMIDVFMVSILTAMVRLGFIASVYPGAGAVAFCSVVIVTMLAAMSFDPRLMWDAAGENG